ncbi:MAG: hypothetical protein NZM15_10685 [Flavobacteriales bacterium]|nr:hypothetical protein [Flavobacteriales bacterium]MDW8433151.1 hypothetical protein [Flavobacteriales bacterium]
MHITRNDNVGMAVSMGLHLLLLLLFMWIKLLTEKASDSGGGMTIDIGIAAEGTGNDPQGVLKGNTPPSTSVSPSTEAKAVQPDEPMLKTSDPEAPAIEDKPVRRTPPVPSQQPPRESKQPAPAPPSPQSQESRTPRINQQALFPGASGGQGQSGNPGNLGDPTGAPDGGRGGQGHNPNQQGLGSGEGPGRLGGDSRGSGIRIDLAGRTPRQIFKPDYNVQEEGRVVVKISVDKQGNVVAATTDGVKGSTTTSQVLHQKAIDAARRCKFDVKPDAPPVQVGYITYNFILGD